MTRLQTRSQEESSVIPTSAIHAKAVELGKHVLSMTTAAGSGHPSTALAISHIVVELMYRRMRYDPTDPWNPNSDRLVLSAGHAVPMIYAAYADLGGAVGVDPEHPHRLNVGDLASLREQFSVLDGHPNPAEGFPFFDAATGSLGQGLSVAAGLALGARLDKIDKQIYVIAGDGETREGQVWEAADFAVDHGLSNICAIFSCNGHGQASAVSPQQSPDAIAAKMAAFGWHVIQVDGHDPQELSAAFDQMGSTRKPVAIVARTIKGWGVEMMLGKNYHGKPLKKDDLAKACSQLDQHGKSVGAKPGDLRAIQKPASATRVEVNEAIRLPAFEDALRRADQNAALKNKKLSTRVAYGAALAALGEASDAIVCLDADVSNSTFSNIFAARHPDRFFECKIAEQNMVTAASGLAATGKIPFANSFAKFICRAIDQIDMVTISRANVKIVGSHSGISLGADGPSQMSMSDMAYFRSMTRADTGQGGPVCHLFHPSDAICAYRCTQLMANTPGLCVMRTHREASHFLYPFDEMFALRSCKQLRTGKHLTLVGSGFMVHTVLAAADALKERGVECNVFDAYTFPFDSTPILDAAQSSGGFILTVEDNYIGGLHAELAEAAALAGEIRVHGMTVKRIPKSARSPEEVFAYTGVSRDQIMDIALTLR